jgi:hypothetical protein
METATNPATDTIKDSSSNKVMGFGSNKRFLLNLEQFRNIGEFHNAYHGELPSASTHAMFLTTP